MSNRGLIALLATAVAVVVGQAAIGSAQAATTVSVIPSSPVAPIYGTPFGETETWGTNTVWVYKSVPAFNFAGGGLLIRFSNPGGVFATDPNDPGSPVEGNTAAASDSSGQFVERIVRDLDGVAPWTGDIYTDGGIGGFRLSIADVPPAPPTSAPTAPLKKKKCKKHKKRSASAAKKCKKKKRR